jgi:hypothetical protein
MAGLYRLSGASQSMATSPTPFEVYDAATFLGIRRRFDWVMSAIVFGRILDSLGVQLIEVQEPTKQARSRKTNSCCYPKLFSKTRFAYPLGAATQSGFFVESQSLGRDANGTGHPDHPGRRSQEVCCGVKWQNRGSLPEQVRQEFRTSTRT